MSLDYRALLMALERRLGTCHILVRRDAREPAAVLVPTGIHDRLVKQLTQAIYRGNRCYHIRAPVQARASLAALLPVRAQALEDPRADLATVHFLNDFQEAVRLAFGQTHGEVRGIAPPAFSGQVLAFPASRRAVS